MDTQRLILFVVFSLSLLLLWQAWQREHQPPLPPASTQPAPGAGVSTSPTPPPGAPALPAATGAPVAVGEKVVVKTDLYTANIDTLGGVIEQVALSAHRDTQDETKP